MKIIESITIRYFRSVYTLVIGKCGDITVITGKNDVGKSNILKALNLFFCQQADYMRSFDFSEDYSLKRKEEVRKDTIRGQQFISISVRFLRGDRMENSLPPSFTVTKRWDMHSSECKTTSDVQARMKQYAQKKGIKHSEKTTATFLSTFLNKIKYIYVPAIKDERVFNETLNILQQSLFDSKNRMILDAPIGEANKAIQGILGDLQNDFESSTGIQNYVELPNTLNYANGLLQVNTQLDGGSVTIEKRGDGIRTHYIPKILNYVASRSKDIYIWGFEEPENSYEYRRCIQVADEFDNQYYKNSQIFITSHSPAFFTNQSEKKIIIRIGKENGKTVVLDDDNPLDEELGYIELYRKFLEDVKMLEAEQLKREEEIRILKDIIRQSTTPIILTEGKTDAALLKLAIQKLGKEKYKDWTIQQIRAGKTENNESLLKYLQELRDNMDVPGLIIGMFDRDAKLEFTYNNEKMDVRNMEYVRMAKNIYAFAIPVPHNRGEVNEISIEHYFSDDEIRTEIDGKRLFIGKEFYPTGIFRGERDLFYKAGSKVSETIKIIEHETNCYVTGFNASGDFSISKARFVECIEQDKPGFSQISFCEFEKIFKVIERIVDEAKGTV